MTRPASLPISEADRLAYADDRLSPERTAEIEAWLALNPEAAAEISAWRRQNEALTTLFGNAANEPVPSRLDPHAMAARGSIRRRQTWPRLAAAAVLLLFLGGGLGWAGHEFFEPADTPVETLIEEAVSAHQLYVGENRHAVEVAADEHDHLVSWLSNRVERPITTPDLAGEGFTLVGGRLLPTDTYVRTGPAAQLMYEDGASDRVTVYITAALPDRSPAYQFTTSGRFDAFYWANERITCTVVGDLPKDQMKTVARAIYQQLTQKT
jgi:anti-sigma factor RsiW